MLTRHRHRRGFTLLELIVVLIILGLLAAIAISTYQALISTSEQKVVEATAAALGRNAQTLAVLDGVDPGQVDAAVLEAEMGGDYVYDFSDWAAHGQATVSRNDACALLLMGNTATEPFTVQPCGPVVLAYPVYAWGGGGAGANTYGQATPPAGLEAVKVTGGLDHSLALKADGTVVAWGADWDGQSTVPAGLTRCRRCRGRPLFQPGGEGRWDSRRVGRRR